MEIEVSGNLVHWNYYLALEQDLSKVSRFIEFSEENFDTYSIELAHLLLASSSEVDVVLKSLCNLKRPEKKHKNINDYKETVMVEFPDMIKETCFVPRFGLELNPWGDWNGEINPFWWDGYNKVKHHRDIHFKKANLENTLNSLAALNIVILYYYQEQLSNVGEKHHFKDITRILIPESSLMFFDAGYYYQNLIC